LFSPEGFVVTISIKKAILAPRRSNGPVNHMKTKISVLVNLIILLFSGIAAAQADKWTGVWNMSARPPGMSTPIKMELHIGLPEEGLLYPATIKLEFGEFTGLYEILLVKKNETQLGISRAKYPLLQKPYALDIWMWYINGTFDYTSKGVTLNRMWIDKFDIWMRGLYDGDEVYVHSKVMLREFLYRDSIRLKKGTNRPLADSSIQRILHPAGRKIYFGIYDSIVARNPAITLKVEDQEQYDKDTVTLLHNDRAIFSREQIDDRNRKFEVKLDTGRNIFIYFADNYGTLPPNTGFLHATIDGKEYGFDFSDRSNAYATFLVADIYHQPSTVTQRKSVPLISLPVDTEDIILELRDTAVEDGDSISLSLNGRWVATGFPVKTAAQQLRIKLPKGENVLLFTADNLGRISPNTAELKIIYGKKSKVLGLNTDMRNNNEIRLILE
jgi:hypothetical protein